MHETVPVHDDENMPASGSVVRESIDNPRRSKIRRVETNFGADFLNTFLIEDFNVNLLIDELVSALFIEEDPKTFVEAMRSIDASL